VGEGEPIERPALFVAVTADLPTHVCIRKFRDERVAQAMKSERLALSSLAAFLNAAVAVDARLLITPWNIDERP
jgi:hypothetical protein